MAPVSSHQRLRPAGQGGRQVDLVVGVGQAERGFRRFDHGGNHCERFGQLSQQPVMRAMLWPLATLPILGKDWCRQDDPLGDGGAIDHRLRPQHDHPSLDRRLQYVADRKRQLVAHPAWDRHLELVLDRHQRHG